MRLWIFNNLNLFKSVSRKRVAILVLALVAVDFFASFLWAYEIKDDREVSPKKPVSISASQLTFQKILGLTLFKGFVKAIHGDVVLTSDEIRSLSGNSQATAEGHVRVVDPSSAMTLICGSLEYQDLMDTMTAHDHPVMTSVDENGKPMTIKGRQMELDSEKKTVVINQNVEITQVDGHAEAQKVTFLSKQDKLIMEDDPVVYTSNGQLSGRRITSHMGDNKSVFVEGMADAVFNPSGAPVTVNKKDKNDEKGAAGAKSVTLNTSATPGSPALSGNNSTSQLSNSSMNSSATPGVLGR